MLAINLLFSILVFGLAAKIYVIPRINTLGLKKVFIPILLLHSCRHLGLMFLEKGATYSGIPYQFAYPAAIGDFIAAALAVFSIFALISNWRISLPLIWMFNLEGSIDLIAAIFLATYYDAGPFMGPAYWIPAFWVPALLVTHYLTFKCLMNPQLIENYRVLR